VAILSDAMHVSIFTQTPELALPVEAAFEPGFEYTRALQPNFSDPQWCKGLVIYLDRLIRRSPDDLTLHLQRINALIAAKQDGEYLFAAALDLNTVLGGNGFALQQRIHEQIAYALDERQRADLAALRSGKTTATSPAERYCSLPRSGDPSVPLVSKKQRGIDKSAVTLDFDIGA
jgi:hypothetical protein